MDKLNLIEKGNWYGHPNHKRAEKAPRECVWQGPGHTEPIMHLDSSTDGIIEFESDHFGGQLRGDIIVSKFKDGLRRIILNESGTGVHAILDDAIKLQGDDGLDIAQAPNGVLIDARFDVDACYFFEPIEPAATAMEIKAVFPRRGLFTGRSTLSIYGVNFGTSSAAPLVTVGGKSCAGAVRLSGSKIQCTLPANLAGSTVDIKVTIGTMKDTFARGYRYIKGSA
jgi:IPT/TIG domain